MYVNLRGSKNLAGLPMFLYMEMYCYELKINTDNYRVKGESISALPLSRLVLETTERELGENHLDVAFFLNNLADLYISSQGDYASALPLYQRALKIREQALDKEHFYVIQSLNNSAM